jgi:hypothetical protein
MRGIYLQLKLNLHLYALNYGIVKNGLLTYHIGYFCTTSDIFARHRIFLQYELPQYTKSIVLLGVHRRNPFPCHISTVHRQYQQKSPLLKVFLSNPFIVKN